MSELTPRTNIRLYGHEAAEDMLLRNAASGKLAHGWILAGPSGIGKSTLAYRLARYLLSPSPSQGESRGEGGLLGDNPHPNLLPEREKGFDMSPDDPVYKRTVAGSHADLLVIEPVYDPKKEEFAREISVEQAREIAQFLSLTPGEGQWRVVIVDTVDALGHAAANAILKILEEPPPQAILLLISHNPGRLLPTIRSRCRSLRLMPLKKDDFARIMRNLAPQIEDEELLALGQLSNFAPGMALQLREKKALELYEDMVGLLGSLPSLNALSVHGFAERIGSGQVHANWQLFSLLMLALLARAGKQAAGVKVEPVSSREEETLHMLAGLHGAGMWAAKWQAASEQFLLAQRLHLDYKQVIIGFFHSITGTEGFNISHAA